MQEPHEVLSEEGSSLRQALLSPSVPGALRVDTSDGDGSPRSWIGGDMDSTTGSWQETSFFAHLRAMVTPRNEISRNSRPTCAAGLVVLWNRFMQQSYWLVLIVTVFAVLPLGGHALIKLQHSTDSTIHTIPNTPTADAVAALTAAGQNPMGVSAVYLLLESNQSLVDTNSSSYVAARNFSYDLVDFLQNFTGEGTNETSQESFEVVSYFSLEDQHLDWLAKGALVSSNGHSSLLQVQYDVSSSARNAALLSALREFGEQKVPPNVTVKFTGIPYFQLDLAKSAKQDLARMDVIVLPLALFLVGLVVGGRLSTVWIIPFVTITTTVAVWSLIMVRLAGSIQVAQNTPSIMMSLTLGMGIDYTLFLLARYLEFQRQHSRSQAVAHMLSTAGHVLILSACTLISAFLGLWFMPLHLLQSIGMGAAIAIASALAVNLTLVPALLYTPVGKWIVLPTEQIDSPPIEESNDAPIEASNSVWNAASIEPMHDCESPSPSTRSSTQSGVLLAELEDHVPHSNASVAPRESWWLWIAGHLLHPYRGFIIFLVTCQILLPVAWYAFDLQTSLSFDLVMPSDSPSLQTYHSLQDQLGDGRAHPYKLLFDGRAANQSVTTSAAFDAMHMVVDELRASVDGAEIGVTHIGTTKDDLMELSTQIQEEMQSAKILNEDCSDDPNLVKTAATTEYNGIAVLKNIRVAHSVFVSSKYCGQVKPECPIELMRVIDAVDGLSTSNDTFSTTVTITLAVHPFSDEGTAWLKATRETLDRVKPAVQSIVPGMEMYLFGDAAVEYDAIESVQAAFPLVAFVTTAVIFVLMGVFFYSILAPARSVVSIVLTLAVSTGCVVLRFKQICWIVPVMASSIVVGLALDYDVFLISRVLEFRLSGTSHKGSIAAGLDATGGIITAAGLIMALAFGSLSWSASPVLQQWSFLVTTAVLLDTFVMRTLIVPTVTAWAGPKWCWWPRKMPEAGTGRTMTVMEDQQEPLLSRLARSGSFDD